jgi:hypothetical protein
MTPMAVAVRHAQAESRKYNVPMVLIATRDDWGKATVEYCAAGMEDILYGVTLRHGLATRIGVVDPSGAVILKGADHE